MSGKNRAHAFAHHLIDKGKWFQIEGLGTVSSPDVWLFTLKPEHGIPYQPTAADLQRDPRLAKFCYTDDEQEDRLEAIESRPPTYDHEVTGHGDWAEIKSTVSFKVTARQLDITEQELCDFGAEQIASLAMKKGLFPK